MSEKDDAVVKQQDNQRPEQPVPRRIPTRSGKGINLMLLDMADKGLIQSELAQQYAQSVDEEE